MGWLDLASHDVNEWKRTQAIQGRAAAIRLIAAFALLVPMGCSSNHSPLPTSIPESAGTDSSQRLRAKLDDWIGAVCKYVLDRRVILPSATSGGECAGGGALAYGVYPADAQSLISADLARVGPYAEGRTSSERVVFVASPQENRSVLAPLEQFGFVLHAGMFSACSSGGVRVECPARGGPAPGAFPSGTQPPPPQAPTPLPPASGSGSSPNSPEVRPFFEALEAAQILQLGSVYSPDILGAANRACAARDSGRDLNRITTSVGQGLRALGLDWVTDDVSGAIVSIAFTHLCPR